MKEVKSFHLSGWLRLRKLITTGDGSEGGEVGTSYTVERSVNWQNVFGRQSGNTIKVFFEYCL